MIMLVQQNKKTKKWNDTCEPHTVWFGNMMPRFEPISMEQ